MRYAIFLLAGVAVCLGAKYPLSSLEYGIDKASVKILKEAYLAANKANVITSPLGAILLLALYSSGTEGVSRDEVMTLLGSSDYNQLAESYTGLSNKLHSADSNFTLANKIIFAKGLTLQDDFAKTARSYRSEVGAVDFSKISEVVKVINQWAAEKTKGHIKKAVSEDMINEKTIVALFNVLFFQGHWNVLFKAEDTKDRDFYVNKFTVVKKPTMYANTPLSYHHAKEIGAKLIELPYKEKSFRMVVFLPDEIDGLPSLVDKVAEKGILDHVLALKSSEYNATLYLPKFEIESKLDYKSILKQLGIRGIFDALPGASGIVKETKVSVTEFFQKAIVKVDEEGSVAGAFTAISGFMSMPFVQHLNLVVDRPFLFVILRENVVLFTGTYTK